MEVVSDAMNQIECDIRGQICPSTLLTTLRELNRLKAPLREGAVQLVIKTDSRDATSTIPHAARNMGYQVAVEKCLGYYQLVIGVSRS